MTRRIVHNSDAKLQGRDAFKAGIPRNLCPWDDMNRRFWWLWGWDDAEIEIRSHMQMEA